MNAITRTLAARVTCAQRRQVICLRPDHCHQSPSIEILTFVIDGKTPVWIERADQDANLYHVKIGEYTDLFKTEGQIIKLLEAQ